MRTIELSTVIQRNDTRFVATELGDELVMMDMEGGNYIRLNKTARVIWNYIREPVKVEAVVKLLIENYDVKVELCRTEVMDCLVGMEKQQLLQSRTMG